MTKMAKSAEDLMRQNMMMYALVDTLESRSVALGNAPDFARRRAYLQQRETQESLSWMAAQKLIAMKNILECLIYAAFLFLLPLALLPVGWRFIGTWISLVLWIQLWPPLYAILNFMMNMAARSQSLGMIQSSHGVSLANTVGLSNLHADMAAQAGFLTLSVGALAYALIKGGAASFVHLAGHLASPGISSASQASAEMMSGNYSFGNLTQGTVQASNMTFGQQMLAPSYTSGSFAQNDGVIARTTAADGSHLVNVSNSNLRSSINLSESLTNSYTQAASQAMSASQSETVAFATAQASAYRQTLDLAHHQAHSRSSGEGHVMAMSASDARSFDQVASLTDKFAKDHNISVGKAGQIIASASAELNFGLKFFGAKAGVSGNRDWTDADKETYAKAMDYIQTSGLKEAITHSTQATQEGRVSASDELGQRYMQGINTSLEEAHTHRMEAAAQLQRSQQYSETASFMQQNAGSINANLNQDYMQWLAGQNLPNSSGPMGQRAAEHLVAYQTDQNMFYQQRFLSDRMNTLPAFLDQSRSGAEGIQAAYGSFQNSVSSGGSTPTLDKRVSDQGRSDGFGKQFQLSSAPQDRAMDMLDQTNTQINQNGGMLQNEGSLRQHEIGDESFLGLSAFQKISADQDTFGIGANDLFQGGSMMKQDMMNRLSDIEDKLDQRSTKNIKLDIPGNEKS